MTSRGKKKSRSGGKNKKIVEGKGNKVFRVNKVGFGQLLRSKGYSSGYAVDKAVKAIENEILRGYYTTLSKQNCSRFQKGENLGPDFVNKLAEFLEIDPEEIESLRTYIPNNEEEAVAKEKEGQYDSNTSYFLNSLTEYLKEKLEKDIHYQERTLRILQPPETQPGSSILPQEKSFPITEILKKSRNILVIGETGIGKSSLLHRIALSTALNDRIPVYIDLSEPIDVDFLALVDRITANTGSYPKIHHGDEFGLRIQFTKKELESGKFVFLFDHLDQAHPLNEKHIPLVIASIKRFVEQRINRDDLFVICCRTNLDSYYTALVPQFFPVGIEELSDEALSRLLDAKGIHHLHSDNERDSRLLELGRNPQYLQMLIDIIASLPRGRTLAIQNEVDIYNRFVDLHTQRELLRGIISESLDVGKTILGYLAFQLTEPKPRNYITRIEAEKFLRKTIPHVMQDSIGNISVSREEVRKVVHELLLEGLISLSNDRLRLRFVHDSLFEFFVAWHLFEKYGPQNTQALIGGRILQEDKKWDEIIFFYAGLIDDLTPIFRMMSDPDKFPNYHSLCCRCLVVANDIQESAKKDFVEQIVEKFLQGKYQQTQFVIKDSLLQDLLTTASVELREVTDLMLERMNQGNEQTIQRGILGLCFLGVEDKTQSEDQIEVFRITSDKLITYLNEKDWMYDAIIALGKKGGRKAFNELAQLAEHAKKSSDWDLLAHLIFALGWIGSEDAFDVMCKIMSSKELQRLFYRDQRKYCDLFIRFSSTLSGFPSQEAVQLLVKIMIELIYVSDDLHKVIDAIKRNRFSGKTRLLFEKLYDTSLSEQNRLVLAYTIGRVGSDADVEPLLEYAKEKPHPIRIREQALDAIGEIGSEKAIDGLAELLEDENDLDIHYMAYRNAIKIRSSRRESHPVFDKYLRWYISNISEIEGDRMTKRLPSTPGILRFSLQAIKDLSEEKEKN
jgi:hypothetical protein